MNASNSAGRLADDAGQFAAHLTSHGRCPTLDLRDYATANGDGSPVGGEGCMGADTSSNTQTKPEKVYVKIPKAGPGQGYKAPKNHEQPLLDALSRVIVVVMCSALPLATGLIFAMILGASQTSRNEFLWLWIPMIVLIEGIAIALAIGVGREALGTAGIRR
ncbi:MAG TPA: hypothetical protein VGD41_02770 [Pyrinomonadaceae bacterium]